MILLITGCVVLGTYIAYKKGYIINFIKQMYIPPSLSKLNKHTYQLSYFHNGHEYHILIPVIRGPRRIVRVTNGDMDDVTDEIKPYLGPNQDFHGFNFNNKYGVAIKPSMLNHDKLSFHTLLGDVLHFESEDTIHL